MNSKSRAILVGLLVLFVLLRLPGLSTPYQQDEFKNVVAAQGSAIDAGNFFAHPPLLAGIFKSGISIVGSEHARLVPLFFGFISALLLYVVVKRRFDERTALWSVFLYDVSFYGIWSSLMVDVDGAILPTFFLAVIYCYDRFRESYKWTWAVLLACAFLVGFLIKLSFILVLGVLLIDFLVDRNSQVTWKRFFLAVLTVLFFVLVAFAILMLVHVLIPTFRLDLMISHALYYVQWSGRSYLQVTIQSIKAVFYLSPLLIAPLVLLSKDSIKKAAPFVWYIVLGFIFYFVLFDFSRGALDKYLMFAIVPLSVLSGAVLANIFSTHIFKRGQIIGAFIVALALVLLSFLPQEVVPLYPKTAWFGRVLHGHWNVLTAFNGGSGPVGFYVSFLFIASSFLVACAAVIIGRLRKSLLPIAALIIIVSGITYNAVFMEEFSFGKINGSVVEVLRPTIAYLEANKDITSVDTHNDIGAYELKHIGKYASHFTAAPQFESVVKDAFSAYKGAFMVIDIPPLYGGFYRDFFKSCTVLFKTQSGAITSTVYSSCTWKKE